MLPDYDHPFVLIFLVLLVTKLAAELVLEGLNARHAAAQGGTLPRAFEGVMDQPTYEKSLRYTAARSRFAMVDSVWSALVLGAVVLSGALPFLWEAVTGLLGEGIAGQGVALFVIGTLLSLLNVPLEYYEQFVLEERFGFNKSTVGLWISDKLKGLVVSAVLMIPLAVVLLWVAGALGSYWWVWAFAIVAGFQALMMIVYPMFIMPLFNKFQPLEEGSLRERLMALAARTGFAAQTIFVMDGSRRSAHSNAFFAGYGKWRRIVLFDTLMEQLSEEELEAVLAHEIGHYKCGHIARMLSLSFAGTLAVFALLGWLSDSGTFFNAFGFHAASGFGPALLLFMVLSGVVTYWLSPLSTSLSRKHEYEADAFARKAVGTPETLIASLRKLHEKNLANLHPHPAYSAFYYSHPTLLEREGALKSGS